MKEGFIFQNICHQNTQLRYDITVLVVNICVFLLKKKMRASYWI